MIDTAKLTEMEYVALRGALEVFLVEVEHRRDMLTADGGRRRYDLTITTVLDLLTALDA